MLDNKHSIATYTGKRFWPLQPNPADVDIQDIAHALSNQCRFTGHTRSFYSVAQHSVLVSQHVSPQVAMWGLLHDATEAYLSDIARPVKGQMPEYKVHEDRLMFAIAGAFGLEWPEPPEVKEVDRRMLATEKRDLMPKWEGVFDGFSGDLPPFRFTIHPLPPERAKAVFLARYRELLSPQDGCRRPLVERDDRERQVIEAADFVANGGNLACGVSGGSCDCID